MKLFAKLLCIAALAHQAFASDHFTAWWPQFRIAAANSDAKAVAAGVHFPIPWENGKIHDIKSLEDFSQNFSRYFTPEIAKIVATKKPERLPNGILYYPKDVMGVANAGAGAVGYYQRGTRRYRLVAAQRDDAEQAKDAFRTLKARGGAMPVANLADDASFFVVPGPSGSPATEWVLARKGNLVVGIGDESFALKGDQPLDKQPEVRLSKDEKIAKLRSLLVK